MLERFGEDSDTAVRALVATALVNKGVIIGQLGRTDEALDVYGEMVERFGEDSDSAERA